ncbi:hypothetical protein LTR82_017328 [Friedmanniomyces endolithicus]|uniref:Thioesterase domain-containing protein n=1 Tax=Friedmanniomyces endolithicus TaxID=329885 RepID=A0AAN6F612_9PEZI|nr:hypothetical protein LTR82_017328 [Friedmanniomyces endolithicus]
MPEPGTHEDGILIADLNQRIDSDFKVKVLRGKCLGVAKQLKGSSSEAGGWAEIVPRPANEETSSRSDDELLGHMQGARGLGVERLFWDRSEKRLVAIIWFGGALSGWPGVTHGGAIATVLAEKAGLAAALTDGNKSTATDAAVPQRLPGTGSHAKMFAPVERHGEPAQLSLSYVKPTHANNFYVIRVSPSLDLDQETEHVTPPEPRGGHEYEATLETLDAKICVKAKIKFAPSSALHRVEDEVMNAAKTSYADFRHWLWPSRQQQVASQIALPTKSCDLYYFISLSTAQRMALSPVMLVAEEIPVPKTKSTPKPAKLVLRDGKSYAPRPRSASIPHAVLKRRSRTGSHTSAMQQTTPRSVSPMQHTSKEDSPPLPSPPPNRALPPTPPASGSERPAKIRATEAKKHLPIPPVYEILPKAHTPPKRSDPLPHVVTRAQRKSISPKDSSLGSKPTTAMSAKTDTARLEALEKQNAMLSAALVAVLRTNGAINGPLSALAAVTESESPVRAMAWESRVARRSAASQGAGSHTASSSNGSALEMYISTRRGSRQGCGGA